KSRRRQETERTDILCESCDSTALRQMLFTCDFWLRFKEIAMGRVSFLAGLIVLASAFIAEAGTPRLARIVPPGGQRGTTVEVMFQGRYLDKPEEVLVYEPGITVESVELVEGNVEFRGYRGRVESGAGVRV